MFVMKLIKRLVYLRALGIGLLFWVLYMLWPVYGFLSHSKDLPYSPLGWITLPQNMPQNQIVDDPRYRLAGSKALTAIASHRQKINAPALTAAVSINGQRVWVGAVGWQDIERREPATENTQFRIGSTSKALTATVLARMIQQGTIELDQRLDSVYEEPHNEQWTKLTPRQLASHTAGLTHYGGVQDLAGMYNFMALRRRFNDVEDAVSLFDDTPLLFAPGEGFSYSSLGTVLLSAFMQKASGIPFQQLVSEQVLQPLEMGATSALENSPYLATPYWRSEEKDPSQLRAWRKVDLSHRLAGGGYVSTSSNLVSLGAAYFDPKFLKKSIVEEIFQPQALTNGDINKQRYAIGWRRGSFTSDAIDTPTFHHGGVSRGGQSWLIGLPEYQMVIAINANINTGEFWDFASVYRDVALAFLDIYSYKDEATVNTVNDSM
jgi:CubicO group peptidase (beta-lactamase class C family)